MSPARNIETSVLCFPEGCAAAQTGANSGNTSSFHLCEGHSVY